MSDRSQASRSGLRERLTVAAFGPCSGRHGSGRETAAYLDGAGRARPGARPLRRPAYATERTADHASDAAGLMAIAAPRGEGGEMR
jgi:hypothetical protein